MGAGQVGAAAYLRMFGLTIAAYLLLRKAVAAADRKAARSLDARFADARIAVARYFIAALLPEVAGLERSAMVSEASLSANDITWFQH